MDSLIRKPIRRARAAWPVACGVILWWAISGPGALGGIQRPLYVGNLAPIHNEYGRPMPGSRSGEPVLSRVEIRIATDGVIRPPAVAGGDHPLNPLLSADSLGGVGMNAEDPSSGLFCMAFSHPPPSGTKLFARVYNAPTAAEASFYVDSAVVTVPGNETAAAFVFGAARALDEGDDDGDGLINSWEQSLGIHEQPGADYDGDGTSDLQEMLAGTDPSDPDSSLAITSIQRDSGSLPAGATVRVVQTVRVRWQSMPGRRYQLEYLPTLLGEPAPVPVGGIVTAAEDEYEIEMQVEIPDETAAGVFRVRLVTEEGL